MKFLNIRKLCSIIFLLLFLSGISYTCIPSAARADTTPSYCTSGSTQGYRVRLSASSYPQGDTIDFCLRNDTRIPLFLIPRFPLPWQVRNANGSLIYTPPAYTGNTITPYFIYTDSWNQKDMNGNQVAPGKYRIVFTEAFSLASAEFTITGKTPSSSLPYITLNTYDGFPGSRIRVSGFAFTPGEQVRIRFEAGGNTVITQADDAGNFTTSLTIPSLNEGKYLIQASGDQSNKVVTADFFIHGYYPTIAPNTYYLLPGQSVSYTGKNFPPNKTIELHDASGPVITTFKSDANGNVNAQNVLSIPFSRINSKWTQYVYESSTNTTITITLTIGTFYPGITPSTYYIAKGGHMSVTGTGFAPNEQVALFINGQQVAQTQANQHGDISFPDITAPSSGSSFDIQATGLSSHTSAKQTITLAQ